MKHPDRKAMGTERADFQLTVSGYSLSLWEKLRQKL